MNYDYCFDDLLTAYDAIGVKLGATVFIESDIACLGIYERMNVEHVTADHYRALRALVGDEGTIVVPTFSTYLCNSEQCFDPALTQSEMGVLSEYIRQLPEAKRSYHALTSYVAIGPGAAELCEDVSYLAYGPESPMDRMIARDTWFISIGLQPHDTCSTVHQTELEMGVPYRYIKEFQQQVMTTDGIQRQPFYMHVRYEASELKKNKRALFRSFESGNPVLSYSLGRGKVYGYSMTKFYQHSIVFFKGNPYAILSSEPENKPYAKTM